MPYADPSIILGYKGVDVPDPTNALLKALQVKSLVGQNRLQDFQVQDAETSATQRNALMSLIQDEGFSRLDPTAQRAAVMRTAPIAGQSYAKSLLDTQKSQGDLQKLELENQGNQIKVVGQIFGAAASHSPQAVLDAFEKMPPSLMSPDFRESHRAEFQADPIAAAKKFQLQALTAEQQLAQSNPTLLPTDQGIAAVRKDGTGGSMVPNVTGAASYSNGMPGIGPGIAGGQPQGPQTLNQPYLGRQPAGNFQGDPSAVLAHLQRIANPADRAAALRAFQNQMAGANPTPGADGVFQGSGATAPVSVGVSQGQAMGSAPPVLGSKREEISYHNDPMTGQVMQLPRYSQPGQSIAPGVVPPASGGGNSSVAGLTEAALNDAATRLAHGDQTVLQNYGRGMQGGAQLIAIRNRAAQIAAVEGRSPDDQTASGVTLGGERAGARTAATRGANLSIAANELDKFSDLALSASNSVPRTQFVPLNRLSQIVSSGTGSVEQAAFNAANESVINAFAQVAGRGTPTVAGMEHARVMLNTAQTAEQYAAVVKQLKREAEAALASTAETQSQQRARMTGNGKPTAPTLDARGWGIEKVN